MTEKEAKTKWCPMTRVVSTGFSTSYNKYRTSTDLPSGSKCIASDCMMWVWNMEQSGSLPNLVFKDSMIDGRCGLTK